jgi:phenylacetate-coenzyme A ligase PaaK-like adenylate-forming protein
MNYSLFKIQEVLSIKTPDEFEALSLKIFRWQAALNPVYANYIRALNIVPESIQKSQEIPFLPISFFKTKEVKTGIYQPEAIFTSSGTSGHQNSQHLVRTLEDYISTCIKGFEMAYGNIEDYCVLALLPNYLERKGSSLIDMTNKLIELSEHPKSGFFLHELSSLNEVIHELENNSQPYILLGVTYALLDFAGAFPQRIKHGIIMETGGMKGKREEMIRQEVHDFLNLQLGTTSIHSEYGMTELFSQAYSNGNGIFKCPPWMKVFSRDFTDPLENRESGSGGINIIDLANLHSCCFIATMDLGNIEENGTFSIQGRFDHADVRGCNLMIS